MEQEYDTIIFKWKKATNDLITNYKGFCGTCSKYATLKCKKCESVYYCSKDCQKLNWKEHKILCCITLTKSDDKHYNNKAFLATLLMYSVKSSLWDLTDTILYWNVYFNIEEQCYYIKSSNKEEYRSLVTSEIYKYCNNKNNKFVFFYGDNIGIIQYNLNSSQSLSD
jgi:hypothetical protein